MATTKQKRAIERIVENGGNVSRAMMDVGYTPATARTPQKLTESKGYLELMDELGLTENFLVKALKEDIELKPQNRKPELELAVKMRGMITDKKDITSNGKDLFPAPMLAGQSKDAVPTNDSDKQTS